MKTLHTTIVLTLLVVSMLFSSCSDEDHFNPEDYKTTAELNAEKILSYGVTEAAFKSDLLSIATQQKVRPFKIELPFITFTDEDGDINAIPLDNLLNITYIKRSRFLILYFE